MGYQIFLKNSVTKFLDKISDKDYSLISNSIESLINNPRSFNSKKILSNKKDIYRIRAGRFRIIYYIDDKNKTIIILEVRYRREDTYRDY
jgi:mRNA interferase RelE/StbE